MKNKELIDRIFKEPGIKFELTEFGDLGKPIHEIISDSELDGWAELLSGIRLRRDCIFPGVHQLKGSDTTSAPIDRQNCQNAPHGR